jgi:hypothetical protein
MSYNCDNWKTKEIDSLTIPLDEIISKREIENEDITVDQNGFLAVRIIDSTITGREVRDALEVVTISISGEGSGHAWNKIFKPLLEKSTGKLVAVRVWECGDYIDRLTVVDGVVTEEAIEL